MTIKNIKNKLQILHFQVQDIYLCAHLKYIKKVLPLPLLETLPGSPNYLAGLMNLAGISVPVIDLRMRLGFIRDEDYSINAPLLLCETDSDQAAFIVDDVTGIVEADNFDVQAKPEFAQSISMVLGAITIREKLALLLDIEGLLKMQKGNPNG
ncbi:MAG: chemotaxis protein CheW [Pseudomonadota bacterium]